jgi:hypothetical protein
VPSVGITQLLPVAIKVLVAVSIIQVPLVWYFVLRGDMIRLSTGVEDKAPLAMLVVVLGI